MPKCGYTGEVLVLKVTPGEDRKTRMDVYSGYVFVIIIWI